MNQLKPKAQHELLLASADQALIVQYLENGQDRDVTEIAVKLAYQCDLFIHFQRLWQMRVSGLDEKLSTDRYTKKIFVNRRALYKELNRTTSPQ